MCIRDRSLSYDPDAKGLLSARRAVAEYYSALEISVPVEDIILTTSTSEAYSFAFRVLCNPGDELLIPEPVSYTHLDSLAGRDPQLLRPRIEASAGRRSRNGHPNSLYGEPNWALRNCLHATMRAGSLPHAQLPGRRVRRRLSKFPQTTGCHPVNPIHISGGCLLYTSRCV